MEKIVNLFPATTAEPLIESPMQLVNRLDKEITNADKLMIVIVNDRAGVWETHPYTARMTNSEANLALDILKRNMMDRMIS